MLALTSGGSVGTLPVCGGLTLRLGSDPSDGYWQLAPRLADALNGGSLPSAGGASVGPASVVSVAAGSVVVESADAVALPESLLWSITRKTTTAMAATAATALPMMVQSRR